MLPDMFRCFTYLVIYHLVIFDDLIQRGFELSEKYNW